MQQRPNALFILRRTLGDGRFMLASLWMASRAGRQAPGSDWSGDGADRRLLALLEDRFLGELRGLEAHVRLEVVGGERCGVLRLDVDRE